MRPRLLFQQARRLPDEIAHHEIRPLLVLFAAVLAGRGSRRKSRGKESTGQWLVEQAAGTGRLKMHTWRGSGLFEHAAAGRTGSGAL